MNSATRPALDAATTLSAWDRAQPIDRSTHETPATLDAAQAHQAQVSALREARGERPVGYKIGFTNRSIWPVYGVHHPIWAPVWDTTLTMLEGTGAVVSLERFVLPRLEPEIVFGMARTPEGVEPDAVFDAIDWIAHGLEIVQSPYPDWKFSAAEAIAAQSLHAALLVGPRRPKAIVSGWQALASLELELTCDGQPRARGQGRQVLDNPLLALCHLAAELARHRRQLCAGDVVTTGTLTDAMPLAPGQRWQTSIAGADLPGLMLETR